MGIASQNINDNDAKINSLPTWIFFGLFNGQLIFFKINFFEKNISGMPTECQTVWILIRPDILSGLICVQSVLQRLSADGTIVGKVNPVETPFFEAHVIRVLTLRYQ